MLVYHSKLFGKAHRETPASAEAAGHKLLVRAGYIDQLSSGIFSLLPLGWLVQRRTEQIIRSQMLALEAQEVLLPVLQPVRLWQESGRLDTMDPPLFRTVDRHNRELVLGPTHEEVITDLVRRYVDSYRDLPLALFQIQVKFRNELRATAGLLRVREFTMKDLYSFHQSEEDLRQYYDRVKEAYQNIFDQCGLTVLQTRAESGSIGGSVSHEWQVPAEVGEDKVAVCPDCGLAVNADIMADKKAACTECHADLIVKSCIESAHTFQLGTKYSESMKAYFVAEDGSQQPLVMGCYGIGVGRLVGAIAETHHDEQGLIWPDSVAPFDAHVLAVQSEVTEQAQRVAAQLSEQMDVLFDDRELSAGKKFATSDLIGIPWRVVVSNKTGQLLEVKRRGKDDSRLVSVEDFISSYRQNTQ